MAPRKRKAAAEAEPPIPSPIKHRKKSSENIAPSTRISRASVAAASAPRSTRSSVNDTSSTAKAKAKVDKPGRNVKSNSLANGSPAKKQTTVSRTKTTKTRRRSVKSTSADEESTTKIQISVDLPQKSKPAADDEHELEEDAGSPSYWLMKAEPDSRIEKGKDVKFSIDDLKAATAPEAWDGVRNYVARNNMRLMMKGDMAFFYHSNCKVPGIVGTMEIVQEHSVDESAFDPEHPYYDEKSDREKPKWHVVHVQFRQKFPDIIPLKELQRYAKDDGVLEHMQVLKQSRLSVSQVTKNEWEFIMGLVDSENVAAASAQHQPQMVG